MDHSTAKQQLRQSFRMQRRLVNDKIKRTFQHQIKAEVKSTIHKLGKEGPLNIGLFIPLLEEVPVVLLAKHLSQQGHTVFYPVVQPAKFLLFKPASFQRKNYRKSGLGIWELKSGLGITANRLDVLLMPLVAFDRTGKRLGMGGGFYDRTLGDRRCKDLVRYGIAYELQRVTGTRIPVESWDMKLDGILTEQRCYSALHKK